MRGGLLLLLDVELLRLRPRLALVRLALVLRLVDLWGSVAVAVVLSVVAVAAVVVVVCVVGAADGGVVFGVSLCFLLRPVSLVCSCRLLRVPCCALVD